MNVSQNLPTQEKFQELNNEQKQKLFIFNIDRGGTFTDFYVQEISFSHSEKNESKSFAIKNQHVFKFPSQSSYGQGPIVGIRNFLISQNLMNEKQQKIPIKNIFRINLGTTIATNALLQRKGSKNCMILTKGFKDLLTMRHLARPDIFDLKCQRQSPLFTQVIQADQRVFLNEPSPEFQYSLYETKNHQRKIFHKEISQKEIAKICQQIKEKGYESVGISFCHSIVNKQNQNRLKLALLKQEVPYVEQSSQIQELGYLKRSQTTNLNIFLGPIMKTYFQEFNTNFDSQENNQNLDLKIMKSDGGFSLSQNVKPSQILLSGPAGGLIGFSSMVEAFSQISGQKISNLIGLDMGGTSTDISRVQNGQFNILQSTEIQSVFVCSPHLEIDTIAAGGGSKLYYENGMFKVGPQSVGSRPGPVCYGYGNQLALTDANFLLNRIDSTYFPKIFGPNNDQGLNIQLTKKAFDKICAQKINDGSKDNGFELKTPQQVAEGFITVANELMAKSTRKFFTFGNPDALCIFGSAGGQHCCELAQKLDITHLFVHRYSGVLSAYGLSKAPETIQKKIYLGQKITKQDFNQNLFVEKINKIVKQNQIQNIKKYDQQKICIVVGYVGTNYQITIEMKENLLEQFEKLHMKDNGFLLPGKQYRIEYLIVKYLKYPPKYIKNKLEIVKQNITDFLIKQDKVFLDNSWKKVPFYDISDIKRSSTQGPAMLISKTVTLLVKQNWNVTIEDDCIYLKKENIKEKNDNKNYEKTNTYDPITLTLYSTRLMSIAQEMGKVLQRISISTNIKQRLDFSCGIFDWNGKVLANAPHIPVHLGSMQTAVKEQIKRGIKSGQSILTNHPIAGGSHLPDLTVVTCVEIEKDFTIYVASRGHHADIGGISPGSMPPFSKFLWQEGLAVQKFQLTNEKGQFKQQQTRQLFKQSRRIDDNISDLLAQVAANKIGIKLLKRFIEEQTIPRFKQYVGYICENAASCVQKLLVDFSLQKGMKQVDFVENVEYMDDGTQIRLKLTIDRKEKKAIFDFSGTGSQVFANTNAPQSITRSAIIYSLRSLIAKSIPLNSGCLTPIEIIIPPESILSPSKNSAVVGGNVETSQRIVDLILKPFGVVTASQGTMNNFLFGNSKVSYYETIGGGSGAGKDFHGTTGQVHMTNTRITDVEHLEHKYPVILKNFGIRQNSGGKGKYNGGNGVIRQFVFLQPLQVSILSQRRVFHPYGLHGGKNGKRGKNIFIKHSQQEKFHRSLGSKNVVNVERFDVIRIETPGGGGYGKQDFQSK